MQLLGFCSKAHNKKKILNNNTMRIIKSHPLLKLVNAYLIDHSQPTNINYLWNFGSLLAVCLGIQLITGITLAMEFRV